MESRIRLRSKNHISGSVEDTLVRVSDQVVKWLVDGLIGTFSYWILLSENGIEGHQKFVIDGLSIEEDLYHNGMDTFYALSIDTWDGCLLWGQ